MDKYVREFGKQAIFTLIIIKL